MGNVIPFNPLDKKNLAASIERALSLSEPMPLKGLEKFNGAGVYSLYYTGDFPAYEPLAKTNRGFISAPIYVGKADAKGKRKGGFLENAMAGTTLWKRLADHAASIESAGNLDIDDFTCRFLVVDDLWISLGESLLISKYAPVWNALVDGFGNHNPGKGRLSMTRPRWDTLHPGREWADRLHPNPMTAEQISAEVLQHLIERYPVTHEPIQNTVSYAMLDALSENQALDTGEVLS